MSKTQIYPTVDNIIKLFKKRLADFSGESHRSYQKAFSSFQYYAISNSLLSQSLSHEIIEDWIIENRVEGLTEKTTSFYLDKISSLYSAVSVKLEGGKTRIFKEIKIKLKQDSYSKNYSKLIEECKKEIYSQKNLSVLHEFLKGKNKNLEEAADQVRFQWGALALSCGIRAGLVASMLKIIPEQLNILSICHLTELDEKKRNDLFQIVESVLKGDNRQWFAMRLRPGVKFEDLLLRLSRLPQSIKMPEIFYPCEDIARRVGRRIIWKGRPVIRDVVFFKYLITDIYALFHNLYDLAWCYRNPGSGVCSYAVIPNKAMEEFRKAIGILGPGYEIAEAGTMDLRPGDEVIIVNGEYADQRARILKEDPDNLENENLVYRVILLDQYGHWNVGIDARLLKKSK